MPSRVEEIEGILKAKRFDCVDMGYKYYDDKEKKYRIRFYRSFCNLLATALAKYVDRECLKARIDSLEWAEHFIGYEREKLQSQLVPTIFSVNPPLTQEGERDGKEKNSN